MASYQPVTQEFLAQLESIVPGRVTAGSEVNPDYGRDEMPISPRLPWKFSPRKRLRRW